MRIDRLVPNLFVDDLARAADEHQAVLGMTVLMNHGWIVTLGDDAGHHLSLMTSDASAPMKPRRLRLRHQRRNAQRVTRA